MERIQRGTETTFVLREGEKPPDVFRASLGASLPAYTHPATHTHTDCSTCKEAQVLLESWEAVGVVWKFVVWIV